MKLSGRVEYGIHCTDSGPTAGGESFLLLHGLGGSMAFWSAVAPRLATRARTVVIDVPGFGRSPAPAGKVTLESVAGSIVNFCNGMGIKQCTIVAHSLGGVIALAMTHHDTVVFERLTLVDATPLTAVELMRKPMRAWRNRRLAGIIAAQFAGGLIPLRPRVARWISRSGLLRTVALWPFVAHPRRLDPALTEQALSYTGGVGIVLRALAQARHIDLAGLLEATRIPIDLVRGEHDEMCSADDFALVRRIADVRRELVVPGCRHWPPIEAPEQLARFLLSDEA